MPPVVVIGRFLPLREQLTQLLSESLSLQLTLTSPTHHPSPLRRVGQYHSYTFEAGARR